MKTKITSDIYFAALLLSVGAKLDKVDRTDPRHMEFYFTPPVPTSPPGTPLPPAMDLDDLENQWINNTHRGLSFDYAEAIKRMKSVIHSRTSSRP